MDGPSERTRRLREAIGREVKNSTYGWSKSEQVLERLITSKLPNGRRRLKKGRRVYSKRLLVVDALGIVDRHAIAALRQVNAIRNAEDDLGASMLFVFMVYRLVASTTRAWPTGKSDCRAAHSGRKAN